MKKKIILSGICIFVLFGIFIRNNFLNQEGKCVSTNSDQAIVQDDTTGIIRAEAFRLVSYLYATDAQRAGKNLDTEFQDVNDTDWYSEYIKFLYQEGFQNQANSIDGKLYIRPTEGLNYYEGNLLFQKIAQSFNINLEDLYKQSNIDLSLGNTVQILDRSQFLTLYENVVEAIKNNKSSVKIENLYILAVKNQQIITQKGEFVGAELFYINPKSIQESTQNRIEEYVDCKLQAVVSEQRILYVKQVLQEDTTFENVYIIQAQGNEVTAFIDGVTKKFQTQANIDQAINGVVGNITCLDGQVTGISIKPDQVTDKVIVANEEYIELEKYGRVKYDDNFKIYKVYGELQMEQVNAILVGYSNTQFVLNEDKISAALITEPITATNIKVMLKTSQYKSLFHDEVEVTCKKAFTITYGDKKKTFQANKKVKIKEDSAYLNAGRLRIESKNQETPIQILSIERNQGYPSYRGAIEIGKEKKGLTVINELPLEEYLYAVIPSEMPVSYGIEALKTQAVCARSYAYKQLLGNNYSKYGAHIDDSTNYQVYNNVAETKETIKAVKETYGQVLEYEGDVITAYYFSTSCGCTSSIWDVWGMNAGYEYLVGEFQGLAGLKKAKKEDSAIEAMANQEEVKDFSKEGTFREFLTKDTQQTLEQDFAWYRWNTTLSFKKITENVNQKLKERYEANPAYILTEKSKDDEVSYVSEPIETIGEVTGVEVKERKSSGIVTSILISGTKANVLVQTEYNIRELLSPMGNKVIRKDKSVVETLNLLPSAFFVLDDTKNGIKITGGGYGHGVGMSQNGVKALADLKYKYEEILEHYYKGTKLASIYEEKK